MTVGSLILGRRITLETAWSPEDIARELGPAFEASPDPVRRGWRAIAPPESPSPPPSRFRLLRAAPRAPVVAAGVWKRAPDGARVTITLRLSAAALLHLLLAFMWVVAAIGLTLVTLVRREGFFLLVWALPFWQWPRMLRELRREASECETFLRAFFPPAHPPPQGPFR